MKTFLCIVFVIGTIVNIFVPDPLPFVDEILGILVTKGV